ncbi:MAG: ATP-binding protein, partial [Ignavibacteria bacterium]|nr:ATP-binding protein [Ignavibacteria bacterium]
MTTKAYQLTKKFPILAVIGPRQSGKTTFVKSAFSGMDYVNLEEPDTCLFAQNDPRSFLNSHPNGLIIDEAQRVPELFSYIQTISDSAKKRGQFILTGSQNFLLHEKISQTLAGRVAILTLLPFNFNELSIVNAERDFSEYIYRGFYPPIYDRKIEPIDWYPNYIRTYVERDVRQLKNVSDLNSFTLFVKLCAGRIGQLLNISSIADECGISVNTAKSWLSILESSFVIFRLQPLHQNFNKRLVKMPKIYFYDTGLACSFLGISNSDQVRNHFQFGSLFENLIITELMKSRFNRGLSSNIYFWRDKLGREVDCLIDDGITKTIIEIKGGMTINDDYLKGLNYYKELSGKKNIKSFVIYGGNKSQNYM